MCLKANQYETDILQVLKEVRENKQSVNQQKLENILAEGLQLPVTLPEIEELQ